jgi:hypothetical protein
LPPVSDTLRLVTAAEAPAADSFVAAFDCHTQRVAGEFDAEEEGEQLALGDEHVRQGPGRVGVGRGVIDRITGPPPPDEIGEGFRAT